MSTPKYDEQINQLTQRYNAAIRNLEHEYDLESSRSWMTMSTSQLKRNYSARYTSLVKDYRNDCRQILANIESANPSWAKARRLWSKVFIIGIIMLLGGCMYALPSDEPSGKASGVMNSEEATYWNAENIPIPYLQDASQYVSNPDGVLSAEAVNRMNATLRQLEDSLDVQSVVIVVNHIENDDPFRMAQDVGNKYGVGHGDRGLIVVVAYEDHAVTIAPGRSLEADLTDAECHRLQQRYVVPAMRQNMPDSAMIYLTEALYSTLQKKALPTMALSENTDDSDDEMSFIIGVTFAFLVGWGIFFVRKNRIYQWISIGTAVSLLANPFYEAQRHSGGGFGGGHFGGGGGGGGFSGGSFGGGSFGGGGATSRW
jgi:uncharacterized membrane protein YgcG